MGPTACARTYHALHAYTKTLSSRLHVTCLCGPLGSIRSSIMGAYESTKWSEIDASLAYGLLKDEGGV